MSISAQELTGFLNGELEGDPNVIIERLARIEEANPGDVSFIANPKYEHHAYTTKASALIVSYEFRLKKKITPTVIRVEDPYISFTKVLEKFQDQLEEVEGIHPTAVIEDETQLSHDVFVGANVFIGKYTTIGENSKIYPLAYIGPNVEIGDNTVIHAGVKIYHNCKIGNDCIVHAGVVIGSDGFGFAPQADGSYQKIPQTGDVVIEDNVEIGANSVIDRSTVGSTKIKQGVKLDNLVQIAHNVEIGENTVIAAQVGISGSSKVGSYCQIGGQAGLVGHIELADQVKVNAQSGVSKSVKEKGKALTGSPAYEYTAALRSQALVRQLPKLEKRIRELEQKLKALDKADL